MVRPHRPDPKEVLGVNSERDEGGRPRPGRYAWSDRRLRGDVALAQPREGNLTPLLPVGAGTNAARSGLTWVNITRIEEPAAVPQSEASADVRRTRLHPPAR
jgi:hypothetical protein